MVWMKKLFTVPTEIRRFAVVVDWANYIIAWLNLSCEKDSCEKIAFINNLSNWAKVAKLE